MSEIKTKVTNMDARNFINEITDEKKKTDSLVLLDLFRKITGEEPKMWGSSIIGFGSYHYKSTRSRQEGDWPLTGFSPRKQNLAIYIMPGFSGYSELLTRLGKFKTSVSCLYINKLSDIDLTVLEQLVLSSVLEMKRTYPIS